MTAKRGRVAGGRIKQKEKRTHRHGQMCGDYGGEINGNERIQWKLSKKLKGIAATLKTFMNT